MPGDFQGQVNVAQAPAAIGDWASKNPRDFYDAGPGGLVAGPNGCLVGHFAWATAPVDGDGAASVVSSTGFGLPSGFVHRQQQGLIINYLASSGLTVQPGFGVALTIKGDLWVVNNGSGQATPGMKAYANFADGSVTFAAAGSPTAGGTSTASTVAAGTSSFTASITGAVMQVTAVGSGTIYPGTTISGTSVTSGNQVVSQITPLLVGETTGGIGRYNVSIGEQSVAAGTTISGTYGLLTIGGTVGGTPYQVGQSISGTNVVAGTSIRANGTGTGGAGTYIVDNNTVVSSTAINSQTNVETKYYARSSGLAGELVKISPTTLA